MTTALVTGASSGIGKETAKKLVLEGYVVYAAARRVEKMRDLEELGAVALPMDITKERTSSGWWNGSARTGAGSTCSSTTPDSACTGRWRTPRSRTRADADPGQRPVGSASPSAPGSSPSPSLGSIPCAGYA